MIGKVAEYTLEDDGKWTGPDDLYVRMLNLHYNPSDPRFPSYLAFGVRALEDAAKDMGEEAEIDPKANPPLPEGAIS